MNMNQFTVRFNDEQLQSLELLAKNKGLTVEDFCQFVIETNIQVSFAVTEMLSNISVTAKDGALSELSKVKADKSEELKQESLYQIMRTLPDKGKNK